MTAVTDLTPTRLDAASPPAPSAPASTSSTAATGRRQGVGRYMTAQVAGAFGQSAGVSAGLVAVHMTHDDAIGVVAAGMLALGGSVAGPTLTWIMSRSGRAVGLRVGYVAAIVGAIASLVAAAAGSLWLLVAATALFGSGNSAVMLTRYVLADAVPPDQRGRAISRSLLATTAGAIVGPNLLGPASHLAVWLDLPDAAGLYLVAVAAFGFAATVLWRSPVGRDVSRRFDDASVAAPGGSSPGQVDPVAVGLDESGRATPVPAEPERNRQRLALVSLSVANAAMVSVMALAGVHLHHHGHSLGAIGLTVSLHVAGMFVGSPLVGRLCDRVGAVPVATAGAVLLVAVGIAGTVLADAGIVAVSVVLFLLGVAWNLQVVAGSVLLTAGLPADRRPAAEGRGELAMGLAAGLGTLLGASPLTALGGFRLVSATVAVAGAVLAVHLATATGAVRPSGARVVAGP